MSSLLIGVVVDGVGGAGVVEAEMKKKYICFLHKHSDCERYLFFICQMMLHN